MNELDAGTRYCPACGFDNQNTEQAPYALRCNSILHGRYLVGKVLGKGEFGITYIGLDLTLEIKVAIKEYFPMGEAIREQSGTSSLQWNYSGEGAALRRKGYENFLKEARKMAKLDQVSSIVRVRDTFLENETAYIVMDYVEGTTLKEAIRKNGTMTFSECVKFLRPMLLDLEKVHKQGMIHRDISPDNIMVKKDGSVCLLDLGAAKDMTAAKGPESQMVTKKGFSPLEQYADEGDIGPWTDVYALCATIYYCITGKVLPAAIDRIEQDNLQFPEHLREPLTPEATDALTAGLALKSGERIQSVEDLLSRFETGNQEPSREETEETDQSEEIRASAEKKKGTEEKTPRSRKKWLIAALTVVAVAGVFAAIEKSAYSSITDFNWEKNENEDGIIITKYNGKETKMRIPEEIEGLPVTEIGRRAFEIDVSFNKVELPDSVEKIETAAFSRCTALTEINLPDGLDTIEEYAFYKCGELRKIDFPDTLTYVGEGAFSGCDNLESISVPQGCKVEDQGEDSPQVEYY